MDIGVTGTASSAGPRDQQVLFSSDRGSEATAYARITIPLGARPKRLACEEIFSLEIAKLNREIELLKLGAAESTATP